MAERKTVAKSLKGLAPAYTRSRGLSVDEAVEGKPRMDAPKAAPVEMQGDPTKRMTQAEHDAEMKKQRERAGAAYERYKAKKALGR